MPYCCSVDAISLPMTTSVLWTYNELSSFPNSAMTSAEILKMHANVFTGFNYSFKMCCLFVLISRWLIQFCAAV